MSARRHRPKKRWPQRWRARHGAGKTPREMPSMAVSLTGKIGQDLVQNSKVRCSRAPKLLGTLVSSPHRLGDRIGRIFRVEYPVPIPNHMQLDVFEKGLRSQLYFERLQPFASLVEGTISASPNRFRDRHPAVFPKAIRGEGFDTDARRSWVAVLTHSPGSCRASNAQPSGALGAADVPMSIASRMAAENHAFCSAPGDG